MIVPGGCGCGKIIYPNRSEAMKVLKRGAAAGAAVYRCDAGNWHVTTHRGRSKRLRRSVAKRRDQEATAE